MEKVLVAEDDVTTQKIICSVIHKMGYIAFRSPNGRHAYETLVTNDDFQLLITDVMMPEMDGRELIQKIRKEEKLKNLPIIIISSYVGVKEISGFLETGATAFQQKPIDTMELMNNIRKYLNKLS